MYSLRTCNLDVCSYIHTLMLSAYSDSCFNDIDFIGIADKYLDTVKQQVPVGEITFVKPFDFRPIGDAEDHKPLNDNSIIEISYSPETMNKKIPSIRRISIWINGEKRTINSLDQMYRLDKKEQK
jgi:hypothetical protein